MPTASQIDKPAARIDYVIDKTFDLFCELGATDEQTDFPIVYTSAINRVAGSEPDEIGEDMSALFDAIKEMPMPKAQLTISSKNYSSWSLRGWLICKLAGLAVDEVHVSLDDPGQRAELLLLSPSFLVPALIDLLNSLRQAGKFGAWGASVHSVNGGMVALGAGAQMLQVPYNLLQQDMAALLSSHRRRLALALLSRRLRHLFRGRIGRARRRLAFVACGVPIAVAIRIGIVAQDEDGVRQQLSSE